MRSVRAEAGARTARARTSLKPVCAQGLGCRV
jgi:hypothetical protein